MQALTAQNLSIARGDRVLFAGLSFSVGAGEALHLMGRNGAGKTSLLEVLCGLRRVADGLLMGQPEPSQLHWLGHKNGLNPALSIAENIEWWCGLNGHSSSLIPAALERVGLAKLRHRACRSLSAGQKRRAALARLVTAQRLWWFLDEPLDGLDAAGLKLFAELMAGHLAQGGAAVITSHQPLPSSITAKNLVLR